MNHPLDVLRHYVTGAIERGEKAAIVEIRTADARKRLDHGRTMAAHDTTRETRARAAID